MRALSFLGAAAAPHYEAVAAVVARELGVAAPALEHPGLVGLDDAVADPRPALAFLCGLPYVRLRAAGAPVSALAAPVAAQPGGGEAAAYSSVLLARPGAPALADCRIGFNDRDSLSGWVLPRAGLPEPDGLRWTGPTGSHRRSLELLLAGELDAAPIDSSVLRLELRATPRYASLVERARFGPMPAPPVVAFGGGPELHAALRRALLALPVSAAGRRALAEGGVLRYAPVTSATYAPVLALDRRERARPAAAGAATR
jgi:ABC-type phosphate/phosphonate transport system substrate-binding protein